MRDRDRTRATRARREAAVIVAAVALAACGSGAIATRPPAHRSSRAPTTTVAATTTSTTTTRTTGTMRTTGTTRAPSTPLASPPRTTATAAPHPATTTPTPAAASGATVSLVTAADLPHSYRAGCPVPPSQLRMVHVGYWGFDGRAHVGAIVVAASVVSQVIGVFERLHAQHFPIRSMRPVDDFGGDDNASMAADNTSAFNCRNAVASGPPRWSVHAYGEAIDVDPVENPYLDGGRVYPPAGAAFTDRNAVRAGMAEPGGVLNRAFAAYGWQWGGRWAASPDYQHFSATGG